MPPIAADNEPDEFDGVPEFVTARLRASREQAGLSVRALAKIVDVSPSFISQIETGKANPSVGTLLAIVSALDITLDELFFAPGGEPGSSAPRRRPAVRSSPACPHRTRRHAGRSCAAAGARRSSSPGACAGSA
ncbi:MAG: helix-turn-helix domain-containing protein [Solirubrobacterales bacterium]